MGATRATQPGAEDPSKSDKALKAVDKETYQLIAAGEPLPPGRTVARLAALGLITDDPYRPGRYLALDPRAAAHQLMTTERAVITQAAENLARLPAIEALSIHYDPHRMFGGPGSEFLATRKDMNARIGEVIARGSQELYTAQPAPPTKRDPDTQKLGSDRGRAAVRSGLAHRALYRASARAHKATREYAASIIEGGGEVRISGSAFPRMVIVDAQHLFIDNYVVEGSEADSGWHVFDRSSVAWAREVFHLFWWAAERWQDVSQEPGHAVTTERQRRILRELDAGYSQEQVVARVGLQKRTVAKELAQLRTALGMRSMYQVMAWWGRSRERDLS
ncbi:hypothetical protein [Streptomyces chryseus]